MWMIILGVVFIILGIIYIAYCAKTSEKIAGGVCALGGIMIIVFGSILEGASWREILTYLFVAAIIASSGFAFFFFKHKEKTKGVISLVALALVIGGATIAFPSDGSNEGEDAFGHDWAVAMTVAEKAVKAELKSPSSAEFSSKNETTINVSGNTWTVSGWVEAKNSFGATIRSSYSVKFTFTSSEKYTIEYCNIS